MSHPDPDGEPDLTPFEIGSTLENPVTGELGTAVELPWHNAERRLVVDLLVRPGGQVAGEHRHPAMVERFTGIDGELTVSRDRSVARLPAGETVQVDPGSWHDWWNESGGDVTVRVEVTPGERFLHMAETMFGLARDGHVGGNGLPGLLQLSVFAPEFSDVVEFRSPPPWAQRVLFAMVGMIARPLGYRGTYPAYSRTVLAPRSSADGG